MAALARDELPPRVNLYLDPRVSISFAISSGPADLAARSRQVVKVVPAAAHRRPCVDQPPRARRRTDRPSQRRRIRQRHPETRARLVDGPRPRRRGQDARGFGDSRTSSPSSPVVTGRRAGQCGGPGGSRRRDRRQRAVARRRRIGRGLDHPTAAATAAAAPSSTIASTSSRRSQDSSPRSSPDVHE